MWNDVFILGFNPGRQILKGANILNKFVLKKKKN